MRTIILAGSLLAAASSFAIAQTQSPTSPGTQQTQPMAPANPSMGQGQNPTMNQGQMNQGQNRTTMGQGMQGGTAQYLPRQTSEQFLGSNFMSRTVYTRDNNNVGDINDVLIDRNGQIRAVILGVGGFLGIGEKNVAVPFEALEIRRDGNATTEENSVRIVVNATRADLQNAPTFEEYNWRGGAGAMGTGTGTGTNRTGTGTGTMGTGTGTGTTGTTGTPSR